MNDQNPVDPNAPVTGVPTVPADTSVPGTTQDVPVMGGDNPAPAATPDPAMPTPEPQAPVGEPVPPVDGTSTPGEQPAA
jgi:hypothetical protein